jgi:hypothetical protein
MQKQNVLVVFLVIVLTWLLISTKKTQQEFELALHKCEQTAQKMIEVVDKDRKYYDEEIVVAELQRARLESYLQRHFQIVDGLYHSLRARFPVLAVQNASSEYYGEALTQWTPPSPYCQPRALRGFEQRGTIRFSHTLQDEVSLLFTGQFISDAACAWILVLTHGGELILYNEKHGGLSWPLYTESTSMGKPRVGKQCVLRLDLGEIGSRFKILRLCCGRQQLWLGTFENPCDGITITDTPIAGELPLRCINTSS